MATIGTMRPEEAKVFGLRAGFASFRNEDGTEYGSFEVYWHDGDDEMAAGWYWRAGFPGCLPDGDPEGPFSTSMQAYYNAREQ